VPLCLDVILRIRGVARDPTAVYVVVFMESRRC